MDKDEFNIEVGDGYLPNGVSISPTRKKRNKESKVMHQNYI